MKHKHHQHQVGPIWWFILIGVLSALWFIIRTGRKPSRIVYPCQQIALTNSIALFSWVAAIFTGHIFYRKLRHQLTYKKIAIGSIVIILTLLGIRFYQTYKVNQINAQTANQPIGSPKGVNPGRVVWVHDSTATTGVLADYYNQVNQIKVDNMFNISLKSLTSQNTVGGAIGQIFTYGTNPCPTSGTTINCTGKKVAVKVNFNNIGRGVATMDGNYQPVIALLKALTTVEVGVFSPFNQGDIYIYDASRPIGDSSRAYFSQNIKALFPNVHIAGSSAQGLVEEAVASSEDFSLDTNYCTMGNSWGREVPQLLKDVDYIIDMPLLKGHGMSGGATLSFKNFIGNIKNSANFHPCLVYENNPPGLVGVYTASFHNNDGSLTSLDRKVKLIIGDALYGHPWENTQPPMTWRIFGNKSPNSLFVSQDVVAVDSVMLSTIMRERNEWDNDGESHLIAAAQRTGGTGSLGVHENYGLKTGCTNADSLSCWKYTLGLGIDFVGCDMQGTMDSRCTSSGPNPSSTPQPSLTPTPTPSATPLPGDINGDQSVNTIDLKLVLTSYLGLSSCQSFICDVNGDGKVNLLDAALVILHF